MVGLGTTTSVKLSRKRYDCTAVDSIKEKIGTREEN